MADEDASLAKNLTSEEFARFRDYIHQHSGIYLEEMKADSLRISLITRATRFAYGTLQQYYDTLTSSESEFKELMNLVTINETSFFRFPAQFDALRNRVVPEILEGKSSADKAFRVWSAGCSTGEEPYTISMSLLDSGLGGLGNTPHVMGTDVSTNALAKAQQGVYPARALLNLSREVVTRYFEPMADGHRVVDMARKPVEFQFHNLIKEPYPLGLMGNWDVIFCRNVTIYFRLESTQRVVENFYNSLNPGGYLFIGHSETLTSITDRFEPIEVDGVFLYRKPRARHFHTFGQVVEQRREERSRDAARAKRKRLRDAVVQAGIDAKVAAQAVADAPQIDLLEGTVDELVARAKALSAEGDKDQVLQIVARVMMLDENNTDAYLLAAYAHADVGDYLSALGESHKALAIDPLLGAARYVLGIIYQQQGDQVRALSEFKKTIYIDPGFVLAHLNIGNIHRSNGNVIEACRAYDNAMRQLYANPSGSWTAFLGGFKPDLLAATCERSLIECRKALDNT
ncbi:MAG: hypothetical protein PF636_11035 [Actinomycetota bacterium]|nr:hypothetical protein [Actinomycetota bacterium]